MPAKPSVDIESLRKRDRRRVVSAYIRFGDRGDEPSNGFTIDLRDEAEQVVATDRFLFTETYVPALSEIMFDSGELLAQHGFSVDTDSFRLVDRGRALTVVVTVSRTD